MIIIRTLLTYLYIILNVVISKPWLWSIQRKVEQGKITAEEAHRKVHNYYMKFGKGCFTLPKVKVEVTGLENIPEDETVLFVANHQSYFDIPAIMCSISKPMGFVAKDDLGKIPFFKQWIISSGSVLIARGETRKALEAIIQAAKILKAGQSLTLFPEGTRSADGTLLEFKAGSLKAAQKGKVAIVPLVLDGAVDVLGRNQFLIQPKTIRLTVLPKIDAETVQKTETKVLAETIRQDIAAVLGQKVEPIYSIVEQAQE